MPRGSGPGWLIPAGSGSRLRRPPPGSRLRRTPGAGSGGPPGAGSGGPESRLRRTESITNLTKNIYTLGGRISDSQSRFICCEVTRCKAVITVQQDVYTFDRDRCGEKFLNFSRTT